MTGRPILRSLRNGDFWVSTGEILIKNYAVEGTGRQADDRGGPGVHLSARLRRSGLGRRQEGRPAGHSRNGHGGARHEEILDSVRRDRQSLGAVCRVGFGRQRCVRAAAVAQRAEDDEGFERRRTVGAGERRNTGGRAVREGLPCLLFWERCDDRDAGVG